MNKQLLTNNYLIVRNFVSKSIAKEHFDQFNEAYYSNFLKKDSEIPGAFVAYNPDLAKDLQYEKCDSISSIIGSKVLPTYCFARRYVKGNVLKIHTDRPACEISLTIHLNGDRSWPIWITTPKGNAVSVDLESGDAMVYLGSIAPHWREEYLGDSYSQVFFHYVREESSSCSSHAYDVYHGTDQMYFAKEQYQNLLKEYSNLL
tara:strand:+ start:49 stop:657 length:609 start_codon:yes stop_codon:yes gene_type:complete